MAINKKQLVQKLEDLVEDYDKATLEGSLDDFDHGYNAAMLRVKLDLEELLDES